MNYRKQWLRNFRRAQRTGGGHARVRYTGPSDELRGATALARLENGVLLVQFDDLGRFTNSKSPKSGMPWCYGWHEFPLSAFKHSTACYSTPRIRLVR